MAKAFVLGCSGIWGDDAIRAYQEPLYEESQADQPSRTYHSSSVGEMVLLSQAIQSITPVGPVPNILPKDQEVPAAAAAIRSTNK